MLHWGIGRGIVRSGAGIRPLGDRLIAAMTVPPDAARQTVIRNTYATLGAVIAKFDAFFLTAAHDAQAARLNWCNPDIGPLIAQNSPVFVIDRGYTGDAATSGLATTGFNFPQVNYTQDSATIFGWSRTEAAVGGGEFGLQAGNVFLISRGPTNLMQSRLNTTPGFNSANSVSVGLNGAVRRDAAGYEHYKNGASIGTGLSTSSAITVSPFTICRAGGSFSPRQMAAGGAGGALTVGEWQTLHYSLLNYMVAVGAETDPASSIINAMTVQPSVARQTLIRNLVSALVTAGVWAKLDLLYVLAAHDAQAARLNWKNPTGAFNCTAVNSPAFAIDRGYTGGSTARLDSGFNPAIAGGLYVQDSAHYGFWGNNDTGVSIGNALQNSGANFLTPQNTVSTGVARINTAGSTSINVNSSSTSAHFIVFRRDATTQWTWRNGVMLSAPHASGAVPNANIAILNNTTGSAPYIGQMSVAHIGSQLSDADMTALNSALATYRRGVGVPEAETAALLSAMTVAPDTARQTLINNLIITLKDAGVWAKLDVLYLLAAHDAQAARLNWKNPAAFACTAINAPAFVVDRGYTGGISGTRLDTGFNPTAAAGQLTQNSAHIGFWGNDHTGLSTTGQPILCGTGSSLYILPQPGSTLANMRANANATLTVASTSTIAHFIALRRTSTDYIAWRGGVQTTLANTSLAVPNANLTLLDRSDGATPYLGQVGIAHAGGALADADMTTLNTALATYRRGVGLPENETATLLGAMTVQPNAVRQTLINNLIITLKDTGIWAKLDVFYILAAHDAQAARLNWKNPTANAATVFNSPTFTIDRGYEGDGASAYLNTNYSPATFGGGFTLNSGMFGIWNQRPNTIPSTFELYATYGNIAASTSNLTGRLNDAGTLLSLGSAPPIGNQAVRRTTATEQSLWINGVNRTANATSATNLCTTIVLFGTSTAFFGNGRHAAVYAGAGTLSDTDMATMNTALSTYMTQVGA